MQKKIIIDLIIFFSIVGCSQSNSNEKFDPKGEFLSIIVTSIENGESYLLINQFFVPSKNEKAELSIDKISHGFEAKSISTFGTSYSENELAHIVRVYKIDFKKKSKVVINRKHFSSFPEKYSYYLPIEIEHY